jgi:hypothetical protein
MSNGAQYQKYPPSIWDYLVDMPYMPSSKDRDDLVSNMKSESHQEKRIRLWDYFFRIDPNDVGKPQKDEIAKLEQEMRNAQKNYEIQQKAREKEIHSLWNLQNRTKMEIERCGVSLETTIRQKISDERSRRNTKGLILLGVGSVPVILALLFGGATQSGLALTIGLFFGGAIGFIPGAIGVFLLLPLLENAERKAASLIEAERAKYLPKLYEQNAAYDARISEIQETVRLAIEALNHGTKQRQDRINWLKNEIAKLIKQIPQPPTDAEVEAWFLEDIEALRKQAIDQSELQGRFGEQTIFRADNTICIHCPAELRMDAIAPPFKDPRHDRNKHLTARKVTFKPDGKLIDLYGVYKFDFILIADEVFRIYTVVWDFIAGNQSGESSYETGYLKITSIGTSKEYKKIALNENTEVELENSPSLRLIFENGHSHVIAFPDPEYLGRVNNASVNNGWAFDPTEEVESIIKVINERKRIAQSKISRE